MKKQKKSKQLTILHPWHVLAKEIQEFLGRDPEIASRIDTDEMSIDIFVANAKKEDALFNLLRTGKIKWEDGMSLTIKINGQEKTYETECTLNDVNTLFNENPYFSYTINDKTDKYVMWKPIPVQVSVVNIQDPNGFEHIMPCDLAKTIFQFEFAHGTDPVRLFRS